LRACGAYVLDLVVEGQQSAMRPQHFDPWRNIDDLISAVGARRAVICRSLKGCCLPDGCRCGQSRLENAMLKTASPFFQPLVCRDTYLQWRSLTALVFQWVKSLALAQGWPTVADRTQAERIAVMASVAVKGRVDIGT